MLKCNLDAFKCSGLEFKTLKWNKTWSDWEKFNSWSRRTIVHMGLDLKPNPVAVVNDNLFSNYFWNFRWEKKLLNLFFSQSDAIYQLLYGLKMFFDLQ